MYDYKSMMLCFLRLFLEVFFCCPQQDKSKEKGELVLKAFIGAHYQRLARITPLNECLGCTFHSAFYNRTRI